MNRYWNTALDLDRRMREAGIEYAVIKSYGAHQEFNDSNIDVVCLVPLDEVYRRVYPDYTLSTKDSIKANFYEHNKLMVKHPQKETSDIHLHTNAGWHDIEFVSGEEIFANRIDYALEGGRVKLITPTLDKKILTLQVMFENFMKKKWDVMYLDDNDYTMFADEYGVTPEEIAPVKQAEKYIELSDLRPIWRKYYRKRKTQTRVTLWNRFLHLLFVVIHVYRKSKIKA